MTSTEKILPKGAQTLGGDLGLYLSGKRKHKVGKLQLVG